MVGVSEEPLHVKFAEVRKAIEEKLKSHELLADIRDVVYGERKRIGALKSPAIWIVPEPYKPEIVGGKSTDHDFTFNFVCLVKDYQPEEGLKEAERLSLSVYDAMMEDRQLGDRVSDVRPKQIDPAYEAGTNRQICFAAVQMAFRIKRRE